MRLIDADKLGEVKFHSLPYAHITPSDVEAGSYKRGWNDAIDSIDSIIDNQTPIEPEIIRCKDCKHHWTHRCMDSMPTEICELGQTFYDANVDFCSLAERRTDETD